jgi:alpha-L-fucosidase
MKKQSDVLLFGVGFFILAGLAIGASGTYRPTWESLAGHPIPEWLLDAKFGIYAHWGVYSVPAFETEWYAKRMHETDSPVYKHHLQQYGDPSKFGYKDFVPMFKAEKYNPEEWARFIEASGAKYAGFAVVHHDGFLLWDSSVNRWNAKRMGPQRDLYGELVAELRKRGLKTIATEHHLRTFNWYLPGSNGFGVLKSPQLAAEIVKRNGWDLADPSYADLYWNELAGKKYADFLAEWQAKVREVIDKYQPDVLWFDGGDFRGKESEKMVLDLLCHYHNQASA